MSALTKLANYAQGLTSDCHSSARSHFITYTETIFVFMYLLSVKVLKSDVFLTMFYENQSRVHLTLA